MKIKLKILHGLNLILLLFLGCSQSLDNEKLSFLINKIADGPEAEISLPDSQNLHTLEPNKTEKEKISTVGGVVRAVTPGFCGDGIMNGDKEQCDGTSIPHDVCRSYGGIAGGVTCSPDCLLDISNCITPAVDVVFGGLAENCRCNCQGNRCSGGCSPVGEGATGVSACLFDCTNDCICACEEKLQNNIERCVVRCHCAVDDFNFPQCTCAMDDCYTVVSINPHIGATAIRVLGR